MNTEGYLSEYVSNNQFPRGFGTPVRCNSFNEYYIPNSLQELDEYIERFNNTNCFLTVYPYEKYDQDVQDKNTAIINVIPFDFDDEDNPENSLDDVKKLLNWTSKHDIIPRLHYSGNKGFHVFIDIEPVKLNRSAASIKKFGLDMQKAAQFKTLDLSIMGDLNRVIRIPNTIHGKTGRYCIPIDIDMLPFLSMKDIEYMARQPSDYIPLHHIASDEINIELHANDKYIADEIKKREEEERKIALSRNKKVLPGLDIKIPCKAFKSVIENGMVHGSRDFALMGIIHKCKKDGFTYNKTFEIAKEFSLKCTPPLNENYIIRKLKYHWKKDYSICTFFSNVCSECLICPHNRAIN